MASVGLFKNPIVRRRYIYFIVLVVSPIIRGVYHTCTTTLHRAMDALPVTYPAAIMPNSPETGKPSRAPVYFLGIGGPNFIENTDHPAYATLTAVGREITARVKPKAVIVFSAHWQGGPGTIRINTAEQTDLIYDFYGFLPHYYEYKYPNKGSPEVAEKVTKKLTGAGIKVERVRRGLDHGVWVGFIAGKMARQFRVQTN